MAAALKKADLAYHAYEFSAALIRAIDKKTQSAHGFRRKCFFRSNARTADIFAEPTAQQIYEHAFR
ncbi:MAG: hypothetical protein CM1200mP36_05040 [Gammaproteobacteria bacterium]|nr:MAG: hypothetical protein CM1200mP36_05040 [Gammaproteobacteria bacterium]